MAVSWHDLSLLKGVPEVIGDIFVSGFISKLLAHGQDPAQHLLGGEAMEWAGKALEASRVRQERV